MRRSIRGLEANGAAAESAINYVMTHGGRPVAYEHLNGAAPDTVSNVAISKPAGYWEQAAARFFSDAMDSGSNRDITAHYIEAGLTNSNLSSETKKILLEGWNKFYKLRTHEPNPTLLTDNVPDHQTFNRDREYFAQIVRTALQQEREKPVDRQSPLFQCQLMDSLRLYGDHNSYPELEAMMASASTPMVREHARQTLCHMRDSVDEIWNRTVDNQNYRPDTSAHLLRTALDERSRGNLSSTQARDNIVQAIFSAYKGVPITADDSQALSLLHQAMKDADEKIRLAAARIILRSAALAKTEIAKEARDLCSALAKSARLEQVRRESLAELNAI